MSLPSDGLAVAFAPHARICRPTARAAPHPRRGDNSEMAYIEFVDRPNELRPARPVTLKQLNTVPIKTDGGVEAVKAAQ